MPSGSAELLSSGPRPVLNPAAPRLPPSAASLTTGSAAENTLNLNMKRRHTFAYWHSKATCTQVEMEKACTNIHTHRYNGFAVSSIFAKKKTHSRI